MMNYKESYCTCRICGHDEKEDWNKEGWWCDSCDAFNYWFNIKHTEHRFTIILEDKFKEEKYTKPSKLLKKQCSPLRYPGGKSRLIDYLATLLRPDKCETIISPFVGGGSFELALLSAGYTKKLILNDLDYGIYSLWWTMLYMPHDLIDRIEKFKPNHQAFFDAQQLIKTDYRHINLIEAAWITLLVNRLAYSGIVKANPLGGKHGDTKTLASRWQPNTLIQRIKAIHALADNIEIHCEDATTFIENYFWCNQATLFIDPPYFKKGKALYNLFFQKEDHERLAFTLQSIHNGYPNSDIIVTYDFHEYIDRLYSTVDKREVIGRRYSI